jgi:hypothetical protein
MSESAGGDDCLKPFLHIFVNLVISYLSLAKRAVNHILWFLLVFGRSVMADLRDALGKFNPRQASTVPGRARAYEEDCFADTKASPYGVDIEHPQCICKSSY